MDHQYKKAFYLSIFVLWLALSSNAILAQNNPPPKPTKKEIKNENKNIAKKKSNQETKNEKYLKSAAGRRFRKNLGM